MTEVKRLGMARAGGGCMFASVGTARRFVSWSLVGNGTLTPIQDYADEHGIALAKWDGTGASANDSITVTAEEYD